MPPYDLSVLIPARSEEFLNLTVQDILNKKRGRTEVIVGLDGEFADPPLEDHPDLTILYYGKSIGQRAMTNQCAKLSKAKWVMKIDAHCVVDEGFDVKLLEGAQDNWTVVPTLYNLHGFDWVCRHCGRRDYQGPSEKYLKCPKCGEKREREIIWKPRLNRKTSAWRFDKDMHFQYWGEYTHKQEGDYADTLSVQGSCFMLTRQKYWELEICGEEFGSWGTQGTEVACKTWLSGGEVKTCMKTWYSHLFRTQGGSFSFPYPQDNQQVERSRQHGRELFKEGKWDKAIHPLSWLLEKFYPVPDWHDEKLDVKKPKPPTKSVIYYTDNALNMKIAHACRKQILKAKLPIVSTSLKPLNFGKNFVMPYKRGYEAYFRQILKCLEESTAEIIYLCEHDWLYHPSHFHFTPPRKDTFYYNHNWWRVRSSDGHAVHYDTQLLPGLVAYRELLLTHYREAVAYMEKHGFDSDTAHKVGFEPGTHGRVQFSSGTRVERFDSEYPIIDIRHGNNLTSSKWSPDEFRSPKNAQNWRVAEHLEGWDTVKGRFDKLLSSV